MIGVVRRAVPSRVEVLVSPDHPALKAMAVTFEPSDDDPADLDMLPFPAPRARC